jgi:hypothetical protein
MKLGSSGMISTALILFEEELFYVDIILFFYHAQDQTSWTE